MDSSRRLNSTLPWQRIRRSGPRWRAESDAYHTDAFDRVSFFGWRYPFSNTSSARESGSVCLEWRVIHGIQFWHRKRWQSRLWSERSGIMLYRRRITIRPTGSSVAGVQRKFCRPPHQGILDTRLTVGAKPCTCQCGIHILDEQYLIADFVIDQFIHGPAGEQKTVSSGA